MVADSLTQTDGWTDVFVALLRLPYPLSVGVVAVARLGKGEGISGAE